MSAMMVRGSNVAGRLTAVLAALMLVFAVACGDDNGDNNDNNDNNSNNTTDAGDDEDGGDEDGGNGECEPEEGAGDCSALCQDCESDDEACVVTEEGSMCGPAGEATQGDSCGQETACAKGYACTGQDDPICRKYCRFESSDDPQCDDGYTCAPTEEDSELGVCVESCELFPNDDCGEGENCYPTDESGESTQCGAYNEDAEVGDSCEFVNDCNDAQTCAQVDGSGECVNLCDLEGDGEECEGDTSCQDAGLPHEGAGVCVESQG